MYCQFVAAHSERFFTEAAWREFQASELIQNYFINCYKNYSYFADKLVLVETASWKYPLLNNRLNFPSFVLVLYAS